MDVAVLETLRAVLEYLREQQAWPLPSPVGGAQVPSSGDPQADLQRLAKQLGAVPLPDSLEEQANLKQQAPEFRQEAPQQTNAATLEDRLSALEAAVTGLVEREQHLASIHLPDPPSETEEQPQAEAIREIRSQLHELRSMIEAQQQDLSPKTLPRADGIPFLVKVYQRGGNAGGAGAVCSFTYEVREVDGETVLDDTDTTPIEPQQERIPNVEYSAAPDGTYGLATWMNGDLLLLSVYREYPDTQIVSYVTDVEYDSVNHKFTKDKTDVYSLAAGNPAEANIVALTECDDT